MNQDLKSLALFWLITIREKTGYTRTPETYLTAMRYTDYGTRRSYDAFMAWLTKLGLLISLNPERAASAQKLLIDYYSKVDNRQSPDPLTVETALEFGVPTVYMAFDSQIFDTHPDKYPLTGIKVLGTNEFDLQYVENYVPTIAMTDKATTTSAETTVPQAGMSSQTKLMWAGIAVFAGWLILRK